MLRLNKTQLKDKIDFIHKYSGKGNAASLSEVDANANVDKKNIATLAREINKDIDVQLNRYLLEDRIKEMFGEELSIEYIRQLENHEIYSHDESALLMPYCVAIDLAPFIYNGMISLGGDSKAPKHLSSFCGNYINLIFAISAQFAGAVADVSLLTYFDYFARKDFGDNYLIDYSKEINSYLQQIVYTLNQPAAARGYQAVFYNTSIFDEFYFKGLFEKALMPDGTNPVWDSVKRLQVYFMDWFNKEREKALLTYPVITAAFVSKGKKAKDSEFKEFLTEQMSKGNSFFIYHSDSVDSLSSCCRLRNKIDKNEFTYTLGGTGISTGSKKVFTLNMNRLVQDNRALDVEIKKLHKYLLAYDSLLRDLQKEKMLPVYDAGFISFDKQFLTIGLNGVVEAAEYLGYTISNNNDYLNWVGNQFKIIGDLNKEEADNYSKQYKYKVRFNTELVPAENLGVKFAKWDKKAGYKVSRDCYNSYLYIVEDESINYIDKFFIHGEKVLQHLDGGSAYHMNMNELPSKESWNKILDIAILSGCNYFTYNVKETICNECGFIDKRTLTSCSKCNSTNIDYATRVIGYLKRIKSFSDDRQKEETRRIYHK